MCLILIVNITIHHVMLFHFKRVDVSSKSTGGDGGGWRWSQRGAEEGSNEGGSVPTTRERQRKEKL